MILVVFIGGFFYAESPMTAAQLLWINLIMDTLAALCLATEPPMASIVKGNPTSSTSLLKQKCVWRQIIGISAFNTLIILFIFIFGPMGLKTNVPFAFYADTKAVNVDSCPEYPAKLTEAQLKINDCVLYHQGHAKLHVQTIVFNVFVFLQLFNMINCRKVGEDDRNVFEQITHNWTFIIILASTFVAQIFLSQYCPGIMFTLPIAREEWGGCICLGAMALLFSLLLKLTPKKWVEMLPSDRFGINEDS